MLSCGINAFDPNNDQVWREALLKDLLGLKWSTVEIKLISEGIYDLDTIIETLCVM